MRDRYAPTYEQERYGMDLLLFHPERFEDWFKSLPVARISKESAVDSERIARYLVTMSKQYAKRDPEHLRSLWMTVVNADWEGLYQAHRLTFQIYTVIVCVWVGLGILAWAVFSAL